MARAWIVPFVWLVGVGGGCREGAAEGERTVVFAAASLTAPFSRLGEEFERRTGARVEMHFAGTPQLVLQVREGAPCDVFASADEANMARLLESVEVEAPPRVFATNRLTIVTEAGNPKGILGLEDLAREDLTVVLCGPEVPAGRYAREALGKAGVAVHSRSDEVSVKAVVAKVELGEADAGIVYVTDVKSAAGRVGSVSVPAEFDVVGRYPIVVLARDEGRERAAEFVEFVLSSEGRGILEEFGFGAP